MINWYKKTAHPCLEDSLVHLYILLFIMGKKECNSAGRTAPPLSCIYAWLYTCFALFLKAILVVYSMTITPLLLPRRC